MRTIKKKYNDHKHQAHSRGIEFLISYEDWLEMWLESGRWEQRGSKKGQYQMTRKLDKGPYSKNNCVIKTVEENQAERHNVPDGQTGDIIMAYLRGETQQSIADRYGYHQSTISKIVTGSRRSYYV